MTRRPISKFQHKDNGNSAVVSLSLAIAGGFLLGGALGMMPRRQRVLQPSKQVDLQRYLGRWYELARYENRFERGCEAVTADYTLLPDGRISVRNTCRCGSPTGSIKVATGKAKILPNSANSKLKVSFFGPLYLGDYWVMDRADDYSWSIVGEPTRRYLWILARDPHPDAEFKQFVTRRAAELGYDITRLRQTIQQPSH